MARRNRREDDEIGQQSAGSIAEELQQALSDSNDLRGRLAIAEGKLRVVQILLEGTGNRHYGMTVEAATRELDRRRRALPPHRE